VQIEIEKTDPSCFADNCPAVGKVIGLPGWKLYIGKRPETLLDQDALTQLRDRVGPDECAALLPDSM
jgi:hypothetical protein